MRRFIFLGALALAALISCSREDSDPRLVIITLDGLRWQELFSGADEGLVDNTRFVRDTIALKQAYWRETPQKRREALMPFIWSYVPEHGYLIGNRNRNSLMQVANTMHFSYPGYSEMFCGWPDDERINSNDPNPNPNVSVLEVVNRDPRYSGKVMMYSSWESIRYAVNNERGAFPGSSGHEPSYTRSDGACLMQDIDAGMAEGGIGPTARVDCITFGMAMETLKTDHPKVFYVGFGDTDSYAHKGRYDLYLDAAHWTDLYISRIVAYCESDPFYKGKTTYLITCDHGRGTGAAFRHHGDYTRGSHETWFIAFGKGVPVQGETSDNGIFYTKQFAATIADVLGIDFTPGNGEKCAAIDPSYRREEDFHPVASAVFPPVKATPKGQGLRYAYKEGDFTSCEDMLAAPLKKRGITPLFGTEAIKEREDHFGIVFQGLMNIEKEGLYFFTAESDDGSRIWLDGRPLWDLDRPGGGSKEAWIELGAGYHRLEVQYFETWGGECMNLGLKGPGIDVPNLPASMLFYE